MLYLCEKPDQGSVIAKYLGANQRGNGCLYNDSVTVTWAIGHLIEQDEPGAYGEQYKQRGLQHLPVVPQGNAWIMRPKASTQKQLTVVKGLIKKAALIVIATDPDREGEMIGRELLDYFNYRGPVKRLWLSSLDPRSVKAALDNLKPGSETEDLYAASLGRSRADWLIGMNLSRTFTATIGAASGLGSLPVGRVQTPTLAIVVERDRQIEAFTAKTHYSVDVQLSGIDPQIKAAWQPLDDILTDGICLDKSHVERLASKLKNQTGVVDEVVTTPKQTKPTPLFDLSSLQEVCNSRWAFSADKTLSIAQGLYEKYKVTTYPRTESRHLPTNMQPEITQVLQSIALNCPQLASATQGADSTLRTDCWNDAKITPHHAIIPNMAAGNSVWSQMDEDSQKVYTLIARHYLAQFYSDYTYDETVITINIAGEKFKIKGNITTSAGWKAVAGNLKEDVVLPKITQGQSIVCEDAICVEKQTKPPARMTEATLLRAMKNVGDKLDAADRKILKAVKGIGTAATRANIIKNLVGRGYLKRVNKKELHSTPTAQTLINALPTFIKSPEMTAKWEYGLEQVSVGKVRLDDFMSKQIAYLHKIIDAAKAGQFTKNIPIANPCPKCGKPLTRHAYAGKKITWSCSDRDVCGARYYDKAGKPGDFIPPPKITDEHCPECGDGMLVERASKSGTFFGCNNYPKCKYSRWPNAKEPEDAGKDCPKCEDGRMQIRTAHKGDRKGQPFMGCNQYPKCKHTEKVVNNNDY